ncbi:MAG: hypothetical protein LAO09_21115 [Acidobacteriia bacterium]|nr:hypothetical protein [Terriglobia bacterium]
MEHKKFWAVTGRALAAMAVMLTITLTAATSQAQTFTKLVDFQGANGQWPTDELVQGRDGAFYGTTMLGGAYGGGTVFKVTPGGTLTSLYSSPNDEPDGGLFLATDGNLYGTTLNGGEYFDGTIFNITPSGSLTTLYTFCSQPSCADGKSPQAKLIQAADGNLYGTTYQGGISDCGTIFTMAPNGSLKTLHLFDGTDGCTPIGSLLQATDGNLYGTTCCDGANHRGTIFIVSTNGVLTTLYSFQDTDGSPGGGLFQSTGGALYGTTVDGGAYDCGGYHCGTIYRLDMGFGPFVRLVRDLGKVGQTGGILGQGFTGTIDVSLNGTPASFTIVSNTFMKATVPAGATTGYVTVITPSGTLTSNVPFRVTPQLLSFDPPSGPVGTQVTITGVSLTQTQAIGFGDRVPAQFTVNSDTQVTATVPAGAKTGKVGIETKGGIAISSGTFTVIP